MNQEANQAPKIVPRFEGGRFIHQPNRFSPLGEVTVEDAVKMTPILQYFKFGHLPPHLQPISEELALAAFSMAMSLPSGPETTTGLRKLLEAKDCFVRAALPK